MMSLKSLFLCSVATVFLLAATAANAIDPCCGSHDYEVDGVKIALMGVQRDNAHEITVRWKLHNTTAEPVKVGESFGGIGSSEAYSLDWDSYVVDTSARVKYTVLKDSTGTPIAARHGGYKAVTLAANKALSVWAKFEVPANVTQVSVYLPGAEPFENVPIAHFDPVDGARTSAPVANLNPVDSARASAPVANLNPVDGAHASAPVANLNPVDGAHASVPTAHFDPVDSMHDYEVDGVQTTLKSVKRDNANQITVRWELRNTTADAVRVGDSFTGMGSSEAFSLVWDAYVVDPNARIKYPILKDSTGTPVAAYHGGGKAVTLAGHKSLTLWAKFPISANARMISVYLPGTEPFENVPVAPNEPPDGAR